MDNPYLLPVPSAGTSPVCQARRMLEPFITEHMEGFGEALEGRAPKDPAKRVRAHQLLRVAGAAAVQARHVATELTGRNPVLGMSMEAALANSVVVANITSFITQAIHMSLDVYPRLIANRLVSVQPFTQPSGYVFFLKRRERNVATPSADGRDMSDLTQFDKTYGDWTAEGQQIKAVGMELTKTLVECKYKALMHQESHQVDVALRTQYGLDAMSLGDIATADELAWEVDREVVDDVVVFAATNPRGTVYFDPTAGGSYTGYAPSEKQFYDQQFLSKTLTAVAIDMASDIFRTPNWYVCGANVAKLMARTPGVFAKQVSTDYFDQMKYNGSILAAGVTTDGITIWTDPQMDADTMICGHVDNMNPFYAGYAFCPFGTASILTAAFTDPDNLLTKKSRALAFAKVGIRSRQFRKIKLGSGS